MLLRLRWIRLIPSKMVNMLIFFKNKETLRPVVKPFLLLETVVNINKKNNKVCLCRTRHFFQICAYGAKVSEAEPEPHRVAALAPGIHQNNAAPCGSRLTKMMRHLATPAPFHGYQAMVL
jgi:hypothetical protein